MRIYGIFPVEQAGPDSDPAHVELSKAIVVRMVFDSLRSGGDRCQYTLDWTDRSDADGPLVVRLETDETLLLRLEQEINSGSPARGIIRSLVNCRAVTFGYDWQAFLCLRHEDAPPVSPDSSLVVVEERPDILTDFDYFDGWVPAEDEAV